MTEHVGRVGSIWRETTLLCGMKLDVDPEVARSHTRPGQYLVLRHEDRKPVILAIASTPREEPPFELLLGPDAQGRLPAEAGAPITVGHAQGKGFPIEAAEGRDVVVFAVGTALSAIRPLLAEIASQRSKYRRVVLFMGAKRWEEHPYQQLDESWRAAEIEVRRSVGRPWVQDLFLQEPLPLDRAFGFVCGMPQMIDSVKRVLIDAGLAADRIGVNW